MTLFYLLRWVCVYMINWIVTGEPRCGGGEADFYLQWGVLDLSAVFDNNPDTLWLQGAWKLSVCSGKERLSGLVILCIENERAQELTLEQIEED